MNNVNLTIITAGVEDRQAYMWNVDMIPQ